MKFKITMQNTLILAMFCLFFFTFFLIVQNYVAYGEEDIQGKNTSFEKYIKEAKSLVDSDPLTAIALINVVCQKYKRYQEGIRILEEIGASKKNLLPEVLVNIQLLYIKGKNYRKAEEIAREISKSYPGTEHEFWTLGNVAFLIYEERHKWKKAEPIYRSLIKKAEKSEKKYVWMSWPYIYLGRNLYHQNKFNDAIASLSKGIDWLHRFGGRFGPYDPTLYNLAAEAQFMIGQSYRKLGKIREAKEAYQRVLDKYVKSKKWSEKARIELTK